MFPTAKTAESNQKFWICCALLCNDLKICTVAAVSFARSTFKTPKTFTTAKTAENNQNFGKLVNYLTTLVIAAVLVADFTFTTLKTSKIAENNQNF